MKTAAWVIILGCFVFPPGSQAKETAKNLEQIFGEVAQLPIQERVLKSTETLKNSVTGIGPLGEGKGLDPNPAFSLDKFDCTTYVETNLAIAFSKTAQEVPTVMNKIRYQGDNVDYFERNHFMVSDWIPSNSGKGFVTPITDKLSSEKSAFHTDKKVLNKTVWFYHRAIDLLDEQKRPAKEILGQLSKIPILPVTEDKTTYLLANYFRANEKTVADQLPQVSVVMFIRNIPSSPTLVNHMGFVLKKNGKLYLNHAPQTKPWRVQEVPLEDYFKEMDAHRAPIDGLLFLAVGKT